jgi:hypothetical protein
MRREQPLDKIKPIMALVCDEVRLESNGKPFIIGIYTGSIDIEAPITPNENGTADINPIPAIPITLWVPFEASDAGKYTLAFKLEGPGPKDVLEFTTIVTIDKPAPGELKAITAPFLPLPLTQSGKLKISYRHENESEWHNIRTIPVNIKQPTHSKEK